jgi:hypothetical protein
VKILAALSGLIALCLLILAMSLKAMALLAGCLGTMLLLLAIWAWFKGSAQPTT